MSSITLPPLFTPVAFTAEANLPGEVQYRARRGKIEPGTVCYSERPDILDAILLLAPETPLRHSIQVAYVLSLAANDALGACIPATIGVHLGWPDRLFVNAGLVGGIAIHTECEDLDAVPDWMMARLTIDVMGDPNEANPGRSTDRTALYQEGAGETSAPELLTAFCRYFLNWLHRWQKDGLAPISPAWLDRAAGREKPVAFPDSSGLVRGTPLAITQEGDLRIKSVDGPERILPLTGLLEGPTWEL